MGLLIRKGKDWVGVRVRPSSQRVTVRVGVGWGKCSVVDWVCDMM